jgi:endonuclease YncB( thermonuclease family)
MGPRHRCRAIATVLAVVGAGLLAAPAATAGEVLRGTCVGVPEADRIEVWLGPAHGVVTVILDGVDGVSLRQSYGRYAQLYVQDQVRGKEVTVEVRVRRGPREVVGRVIVDRRDLAYQIIAEGLAVYDGRAPSGQRLQVAEERARQGGRGLWAGSNPTPTPEVERQLTLSDIAWQLDEQRARAPWPTPTPAGTPDPTIEARIEGWVGAHQDELLVAWGAPSRLEGDGRGGTILVYDRFVDGEGRPVAGDEVEGGTVVKVLSELFFVDPEGVIYHRATELPAAR